MGKREINSLEDSKKEEIIYCSDTKRSPHEEGVIWGGQKDKENFNRFKYGWRISQVKTNRIRKLRGRKAQCGCKIKRVLGPNSNMVERAAEFLHHQAILRHQLSVHQYSTQF